jgi:hypothetical protein
VLVIGFMQRQLIKGLTFGTLTGDSTCRPHSGALAPAAAAGRWARSGRDGYTRSMTRALDTAIAKLTTLPADEQDRIARWLLEELRDEEHWARQFAESQSALGKLAAEARGERAAGRATDLDPDKL